MNQQAWRLQQALGILGNKAARCSQEQRWGAPCRGKTWHRERAQGPRHLVTWGVPRRVFQEVGKVGKGTEKEVFKWKITWGVQHLFSLIKYFKSHDALNLPQTFSFFESVDLHTAHFSSFSHLMATGFLESPLQVQNKARWEWDSLLAGSSQEEA